MSALEVLGAALIWAAAIAAAVPVAAIILHTLLALLDIWRIKRSIWHWKGIGYVDEEEFEDWMSDKARQWFKPISRQNAWSREEDFRQGCRAAAKHLLRNHGIPVVTMKGSWERAKRRNTTLKVLNAADAVHQYCYSHDQYYVKVSSEAMRQLRDALKELRND